MLPSRFDTDLKHINLNGVTLSIEEQLNLKLAISQLQSDLNIPVCHFWGKIIGKTPVNDFYRYCEGLLHRLLGQPC